MFCASLSDCRLRGRAFIDDVEALRFQILPVLVVVVGACLTLDDHDFHVLLVLITEGTAREVNTALVHLSPSSGHLALSVSLSGFNITGNGIPRFLPFLSDCFGKLSSNFFNTGDSVLAESQERFVLIKFSELVQHNLLDVVVQHIDIHSLVFIGDVAVSDKVGDDLFCESIDCQVHALDFRVSRVDLGDTALDTSSGNVVRYSGSLRLEIIFRSLESLHANGRDGGEECTVVQNFVHRNFKL